MDFVRRLMLFGFGIGLGCVMCYFFFYNNRDYPAWLPEDRMTEKYMHDSLIVTDQHNCYLKCWKVSRDEFKASLENADINFSESIIRAEEGEEDENDTAGFWPKMYHVSVELNNQQLVLYMATWEEEYELGTVVSGGEDCACAN